MGDEFPKAKGSGDGGRARGNPCECGMVEPDLSAHAGILPGNVEPLWTVADCAVFLQRSERWVWDALARDPDSPGSIPFVRLPGGRSKCGRGSPRFIPEHIRRWVMLGCPPAAAFKMWVDWTEEKRRRKA